MMIRANSEYLDFDDVVETELQIRLFDEISTANGDFSYSFNVPRTNHNLKLLGFPCPDSVKSIYSDVPCEIIDDSGFKVNTGSLQVGVLNSDGIECSFFGGNSDWFTLINRPMRDLALYKYDVNLTAANVQASWSDTEGIVFPIFDTGTLINRSFANVTLLDFKPCFYVKTLFYEIFGQQGIKIQGELMNDATFQKLLVCANSQSQNGINDRSSFANKTAQQALVGSFDTRISFQDDFTAPYFDGAQNNFTIITGRYTADTRMKIKAEMSLQVTIAVSANVQWQKNGVMVNYYVLTSGTQVFNASIDIELSAADYIEIWINANIGDTINIGSTFKATPTFVYRAFGEASVPDWSQLKFVTNIFKIFNVIPYYNNDSRTLTMNLFNKLKEKDPIDISNDIVIKDTDYTNFVSRYGKNSYFRYSKSNDENLAGYNIKNFIKYGDAVINIDNAYISKEADVVESDFISPVTYLHNKFDMSMDRVKFTELIDDEEYEVTSVTASASTPRFNIVSTGLSVGDIVRIETDNDTYDGEWVIKTVNASYIEVTGPVYDIDVTGTVTLLKHKQTTNADAVLLINAAGVSTLFVSSRPAIWFDGGNTTFSTISLAFFNLLDSSKQINTKYKQSLSFGEINNPLSYQKTIIDTYWGVFVGIVNDPVELRVDAYFNRKRFTELKTFLNPVRVKTNETNNLYYINRISGYTSGHEPCESELIKL